MKSKIQKINWFAPYKFIKGKYHSTLKLGWSDNISGVYIIRKANTEKIIYVGSSKSQIKKTIYRHFQEWSSDREQRHERKVYSKTGIEIKILLCTPARALNLEKLLIIKHQPIDNPIKYNQIKIAFEDDKRAAEQRKRDLEEIGRAETISKAEALKSIDDYPF